MSQLLTGRASVVAARIVALLETKVDDLVFSDPPIRGVMYGDQRKIPEVPFVCVEPMTKVRTWPPTPTDMTDIELNVSIFIYHENAEAGKEGARLECDQVAERIEEFLNAEHRQLRNAGGDDLVIYSYVIENESGYARNVGTIRHAARLHWRGRSKLRLTQLQ